MKPLTGLKLLPSSTFKLLKKYLEGNSDMAFIVYIWLVYYVFITKNLFKGKYKEDKIENQK